MKTVSRKWFDSKRKRYKWIYFYLIVVWVLFPVSYSLGQNFELVDSFKIQLDTTVSDETEIKHIENQIWLFDYQKHKIYSYSKDSIYLILDYSCMVDSNYFPSRKVLGVVLRDSLIGLLDNHFNGSKIYYFDINNTIREKIDLEGNIFFNIRSIDHNSIVKYFNYANNDFLLLPITRPRFHNMKTGKYHWRTKRFYKKNKLVGKFNADGKLIKMYGNYDSVYLKHYFLTYLDNVSYCVDRNNERIFIGQEATPHIQAFNFDGNLITTFGEKIPDQDLTKIKSFSNSFENYSFGASRKIESYEYQDIYYNNDQALIIRKCRLPDIDALAVDSSYYMALRYSKSCLGPDPNYEKRLAMANDRPTIIQVYNNQYEMITEFRPQGRFDILGLEGKHLLALKEYSEEGRYYLIQKYLIE